MNEVKFKANIKDLATLQATVSEIPEIPTPESTDEGKVLTVAVDSSGETPVVSYELEEVDALPAISAGDAGKVLTVNAGETGAEWASASGGGADEFVITASNFEYDSQLDVDTFDTDKTFAEISAEVSSLTPRPIFLFDSVYTRSKIPCAEILYNDRTGDFVGLNFYLITGLSNTDVQTNGQINYSSYQIQNTGNIYNSLGYIQGEAYPAP